MEWLCEMEAGMSCPQMHDLKWVAKGLAAESVERRAAAKGNANQHGTCRTQSRVIVSQALERIRRCAGSDPHQAVITQGRSRMP